VEEERLSYRDLIQRLNQVTLNFARKAGEKDHIFGSVSSGDIKDALDKLGFDIDKKKIVLDEPIKRLGSYSIPVKIYHDDRAEIKVHVVKDEEEPAEPAAKPETQA
jgi:large subunit ribosomal protein L9